MRKTLIVLLSALVLAAFAACGAASAQPSPETQSPAASDTAPSEASASDPQDGAEAADGQRLIVADAASYQGTLSDFAMSDDGKTVWILKQESVLDAELPTLNVMVDENTKFSFDSADVGNGAQLEVFYSGDPAKGDVTAIAVNRLSETVPGEGGPNALAPDVDADALTYEGTVVSVTLDPDKPGEGSIEMTSLEGDNPYVFNFGPETEIGVDLKTLKAGDKLLVVHSMIATRSIPPQSPAFEISAYTE